MELFVIYLWLKLDLFIRIFIAGSLFAGIGISFIYAVSPPVTTKSKEDYYIKWSKPYKRFLLAISILFTFGVLLPSSKDLAILIGASYAVDFAKSPEGAKIGTLIRKKANDYLDEQLKEVAKVQQPAPSKP